MATIKDIAKLAGVSVTTVSKVINNYPDISDKTKEKVIKIMEQQNYRPNAIARSLSTSRSRSIGVFFTDHLNSGLRHPFFRDIIYGIEKTFFRKGYDLILFAHQWGDRFSYTEKCKSRHVDGAILMGMPRTDPNLDKLVNSNIPTVFIDLDIVGKNATYVISDNVQGAKQAVNYLYSLGHIKIGMIMGQRITKPAQDRLIGFQEELTNLGLEYNPEWIIEAEFGEEGGYQAMKRIITQEIRPSAVFCQGDEMAIGAINAIKEHGYNVPQDFSIVGFDNIEISSYVSPGLTTIHQDKLTMGKKAASILLEMINNPNKTFSPVVLPTKLIERESCRKIG
ncbi:LacI family DNA-binding transcriptional regulator [Halothermothrix orenii]|uniref:Transcriptional regulator, LacI family n=1 Tax=Halothermothrix orenii (strain H 168 / OCM 544 / DSM 9562) TaxID=373903 RepID=B8CZK8_HALOH|nr:LacI family DNA-binding transcriptional regulator [Halothermothrix orenii]ACL70727.1 transcriptional regulator, LacI family [Halothermothrix orenii H 168]